MGISELGEGAAQDWPLPKARLPLYVEHDTSVNAAGVASHHPAQLALRNPQFPVTMHASQGA
jgi:hypothetical protein